MKHLVLNIEKKENNKWSIKFYPEEENIIAVNSGREQSREIIINDEDLIYKIIVNFIDNQEEEI